MNLNTIDLIVTDVPAATRFFRDVLGLVPEEEDDRFARIQAGSMTIMLSPDAMVPTKAAAGVILHFQVENVTASLEQARAKGASVLMEPDTMGWGWESAMIAGPEEIVIDFYRPTS